MGAKLSNHKQDQASSGQFLINNYVREKKEEEIEKEALAEETEESLILEDHHQAEIAEVHQEEVLEQKAVEEDLPLKENLMLQKGKEETNFSSFLLQNL